MATVRLEFSPEPAHVRTARLIGVAMARKARLPEERLDEVRLAIGEACGRAVTRTLRHGLRTPVVVEMQGPVGRERASYWCPACQPLLTAR